ncbi:hypothetical protein [Pelagicoccus albus]|uniref:Uncharacterized protein n=1 Tax=Pelagicoccus albus TaxID=415222 RepID=A0A7X1EB39_9BACT|nr:hypothetical protein [Pelagicoccus albus]MBC2607387.1 hypothetical protein [Pelagicoccus albus]
MSDSEKTQEVVVRSLDDLIVTYDMKALYKAAREEFDSAAQNRELLEQDAIGSFFNLEDDSDARN